MALRFKPEALFKGAKAAPKKAVKAAKKVLDSSCFNQPQLGSLIPRLSRRLDEQRVIDACRW